MSIKKICYYKFFCPGCPSLPHLSLLYVLLTNVFKFFFDELFVARTEKEARRFQLKGILGKTFLEVKKNSCLTFLEHFAKKLN